MRQLQYIFRKDSGKDGEKEKLKTEKTAKMISDRDKYRDKKGGEERNKERDKGRNTEREIEKGKDIDTANTELKIYRYRDIDRHRYRDKEMQRQS